MSTGVERAGREEPSVIVLLAGRLNSIVSADPEPLTHPPTAVSVFAAVIASRRVQTFALTSFVVLTVIVAAFATAGTGRSAAMMPVRSRARVRIFILRLPLGRTHDPEALLRRGRVEVARAIGRPDLERVAPVLELRRPQRRDALAVRTAVERACERGAWLRGGEPQLQSALLRPLDRLHERRLGRLRVDCEGPRRRALIRVAHGIDRAGGEGVLAVAEGPDGVGARTGGELAAVDRALEGGARIVRREAEGRARAGDQHAAARARGYGGIGCCRVDAERPCRG